MNSHLFPPLCVDKKARDKIKEKKEKPQFITEASLFSFSFYLYFANL